MSQKRPSEDVEHGDTGRRPQAPRPSRSRACFECKRHKIKCEPVDSEEKCAKCLRSGLECIPYNANQRLQEEDTIWKANATAELAQIRQAVQRLLRHNQLSALSASGISSTTEAANGERSPTLIIPANIVSENGTCMVVPPMDMTRENSPERGLEQEESILVSAPMRSLYDLTRIRNLRSIAGCKPDANSIMEEDFIAQGVVSLHDAEDLYARYVSNIQQLLWAGMLCPYPTLEAVRRHSTLLAAAVLTTSALLTTGMSGVLEKCYNIFVSLTYNTCLSRVNNVDDVRALLLAAFYVPNLSWKLSGIAVRNAVEMNLHQCYQKLMRGQTNQRENVKLWYATYVCEHQFSIAYGRPPMIHQDAAISNVERFLESPLATPGEVRLCAQVALFKTLTEAYLAYGSDPEQPLTDSDFQQLRIFNFAIEQWRLTWQARCTDSATLGSYPSKAIVLYYHFARFQLNSLALRALPAPSALTVESLSYDRREAANIAISAATSTLTLIFEESDLRRAMPNCPIFTHTMVAFCATFLLKMARTWGGVAQVASPEWTTEPVGLGLNFNIGQVLSLSRRSVNLLTRVAEDLNEKHLTRHIVAGIRNLLKHFDHTVAEPPQTTTATSLPHPAGTQAPSAAVPTNNATGDGIGQTDPLQRWDMYDLIGSYGFGFDETYLGQAGSNDFDHWTLK